VVTNCRSVAVELPPNPINLMHPQFIDPSIQNMRRKRSVP